MAFIRKNNSALIFFKSLLFGPIVALFLRGCQQLLLFGLVLPSFNNHRQTVNEETCLPVVSKSLFKSSLVFSGGLKQRGACATIIRGAFWSPNSKFAVVCTKARYNRQFIGSYWRRTNESSKLTMHVMQGWKKSIVIDIRCRYSLRFVHRMHWSLYFFE